MDIGFGIEEAVGTLVLNHSPVNSLSIRFLTELEEALYRMDETSHVKVVIISSAFNGIFSSGLDLRSLVGNDPAETADNVFRAVELVYKIITRIVESDKFYIAAVSGAVVGSAASIALGCDLCIGSDKAWFWLPDPQYGGLLADGGLDLLVALLGVSRARMILMTNDRISARKAYDWGLIYKLVSDEQLKRTAYTEAKRIGSYSYHTLRYTKKLVNSKLPGKFQKEALIKVLQYEDVHRRLKNYFSMGGT